MISLAEFDTFSQKMDTALNLIEQLGQNTPSLTETYELCKHKWGDLQPIETTVRTTSLSWRIEHWLQNAGTTLLSIIGLPYCTRCEKHSFRHKGFCINCINKDYLTRQTGAK